MTILNRFIKTGHIKLQIPEGLSIEQSLDVYKNSYPELAFAQIGEGVIENGEMIYSVKKDSAVGTKG